MKRKKLTYALTLVCCGMFALMNHASAWWSGSVGGPGGSFYFSECTGFQTGVDNINGFNVSAGSYVDAFQPVCWSQQSKSWIGGSGGSRQDFSCDTQYWLNGIRAYADDNAYVNSLQGYCEDPSNGDFYYTGWAGTNSGTYHSLRCNDSEGIVKVRGGAGAYVDSIDVYCYNLFQ